MISPSFTNSWLQVYNDNVNLSGGGAVYGAGSCYNGTHMRWPNRQEVIKVLLFKVPLFKVPLFKVPLVKVPLVKVPLHVHRSSYNGFNTLYFSPGPLLSSTSSNKPIPVRRFGLISDIHLDLSIEQCLHFNSTLYRYCTASGLQMIANTTLVHLTKLTTLVVVHTWQTILVLYTISWRAISITGKSVWPVTTHNWRPISIYHEKISAWTVVSQSISITQKKYCLTVNCNTVSLQVWHIWVWLFRSSSKWSFQVPI